MNEVLRLLGKQRPHRTLRNKIADWLLQKPMHDLDQVDKLFQGFGLKDLTENAAKKDGAKTARSKVVSAVKRRHELLTMEIISRERTPCKGSKESGHE